MAKTRAQLVKDELSESMEHLMSAATYAANGVGASVGPTVHAARDRVSPTAGKVRDTTLSALAPLAAAARDGATQANRVARKAKKKNIKALRRKESTRSRMRWPLIGLIAGGAAIGMAVARRRRARQWEDYDPSRSIESAADSAKASVGRAADTVATGAQAAAAKISSAAGAAADKTSSAATSTAERASSAIDNAAQKAATNAESHSGGSMVGRPGASSPNSRT